MNITVELCNSTLLKAAPPNWRNSLSDGGGEGQGYSVATVVNCGLSPGIGGSREEETARHTLLGDHLQNDGMIDTPCSAGY